jgi:hypothetical protein
MHEMRYLWFFQCIYVFIWCSFYDTIDGNTLYSICNSYKNAFFLSIYYIVQYLQKIFKQKNSSSPTDYVQIKLYECYS